MSNIKFENIKEQMILLINGKINSSNFSKYLSENIKIESYVGISKKKDILNRFVIEFGTEYIDTLMESVTEVELVELYHQYEIKKLFNILFSYTNIEYSKEDITDENYDLIKMSKLYDYIHMYCIEDHALFSNMLDRASGIDSVYIAFQLNKILSTNINVQDFDVAIDKLSETLTREDVSSNLKFLNEIESLNNPFLKEVLNNK